LPPRPVARIEDVRDTYFGDTLADRYGETILISRVQRAAVLDLQAGMFAAVRHSH